MKTIMAKNTLRKYLLMMAVLVLLFTGIFKAFMLHKTYQSYKNEIATIEKNNDENIHNILEVIINETHDTLEYKTEIDTLTLHRLLIETIPTNDLYTNIVDMNLNDDFMRVLNDVFSLTNSEDNTIITVGTKDYVLFCKSNIESDKYSRLETDKKYISWDEYYSHMNNPDILKSAYTDLVTNKSEYVILRIDEEYPNGRYYNIDDVIEDYHKNKMDNMDKYYILTLSLITEDGDIFGEMDANFMQQNKNVNKLYVYKAVSIENFVKEYKTLFDALDDNVSSKIIQVRNTSEFSNTLISIFLITIAIIKMMIVIKSLDDENDYIENTVQKPK